MGKPVVVDQGEEEKVTGAFVKFSFTNVCRLDALGRR
jgi:hypothetical protein